MLEELNAIVTGSGRGLGRAMALALAGADVVVTARTTREIESLERRSLAIPTDIRNREQVNFMVEETLNKLGKVDILVNNAGTEMEKPFLELTDEDWHKVTDTNLTSVFICTQSHGKAHAPCTITPLW